MFILHSLFKYSNVLGVLLLLHMPVSELNDPKIIFLNEKLDQNWGLPALDKAYRYIPLFLNNIKNEEEAKHAVEYITFVYQQIYSNLNYERNTCN